MSDSFSSALVSVLFSRVFVLILGVLFTPAIVRIIGPTAYGQYALILSIFSLVNLVLIGGTSDAVRKYISERSDDEWQAAVFKFFLKPVLTIGFFTGMGFTYLAWSGIAAQVFGEPFTPLFYLLGIYSVTSQLDYHSIRSLMGLELESRSEPLKVVKKILFVSIALLLAAAGYGVEGILAGHIVASIVAFAAGFVLVARRLPLRSARSPPVSLPGREMYTYVGGTALFFLFLTSLYHVDVVILQRFTTDETVGYYKGALAIAEFLWLAPMAVQLVLLQRISHLWERGDLETIERRAQIVTHYVFLFTLLLALGMFVLAGDFVPLYLGSTFTPSVTPLVLLLPGVVGFALARPTLAINQGRRSLRPLVLATGGCSLVNLVLNLLLIPPFGMIGAAIATSIGYGSLVIFQSAAARAIGYKPLAGVRWWRTGLTVGITAFSVAPIALLVHSPLVSLVVIPPLGAAIYAMVAIATGAITSNEICSVLEGVDVVPNALARRLRLVLERIPTVDG